MLTTRSVRLLLELHSPVHRRNYFVGSASLTPKLCSMVIYTVIPWKVQDVTLKRSESQLGNESAGTSVFLSQRVLENRHQQIAE